MSVSVCACVTLVMCASLVLPVLGHTAVLPSTLNDSNSCWPQCVLLYLRHCSSQGSPGSADCINFKSFFDKICKIEVPEGSADSNHVEAQGRGVLSALGKRCRDRLGKLKPRTRRGARSGAVREAALIARSVGLVLGESYSSLEEANTASETQPTASPADWGLQATSAVRGPAEVTLTLAWAPPPPATGPCPWYLVSWWPDDDALRGSLLTNTSTTQLTVLPDAVYHIQVSTMDSGLSSECLEVDTHSAPEQVAPPKQRTPFLHAHALAESSVGAAVAILLFLALLLVVAWRRRRWTSKDGDQLEDCNHFKVFPPPVTIEMHLKP